MNYYLETKMLTKQYGSHYAVKGLNLHVKRGDVYGLIGPNGAGKTTLMKMVAGFVTPTDGQVNLFQEEDGQRRIGCLIENPGLYGNIKQGSVIVFHKSMPMEKLNYMKNGNG